MKRCCACINIHLNYLRFSIHYYYACGDFFDVYFYFKPERDPNAPKKPCNAFFQFCQEQRPLVVAEANSELGSEPSKQEVTRQLATRWKALNNEEKRVIYWIIIYFLPQGTALVKHKQK